MSDSTLEASKPASVPAVGAASSAKQSALDKKRSIVLFGVVALVATALVGGFLAASLIQSPADVAARTAPPTPSPILVPVEQRALSSSIVTRGTARFGLPRVISIAPSTLKGGAQLITTLPLRNTQIEEGGVLLTASGRPLLVLQGDTPAYRDLVPGSSGRDVQQLEEALARLGFDPGPIDGRFDAATSDAVAAWYEAAGWEPFGPTLEQRQQAETLERDLGEARKAKVAADAAATAAELAVSSARASAERDTRTAAAELAARRADRERLVGTPENGIPLVVKSERARAERANTAAKAELTATIAERALVVLDPRQPKTAKAAAEARLELARANARNTELEGQLAVQAAERDAKLAREQLELAESALEAAQLAGEMAIRSALDAQKVARLDAQLADDRVERLSAELALARSRLGVQVPLDEIVFIPALPVRVEEITAQVGDPASGPLLSVTDNQLAIDSAVALDSAPLLKPGMRVEIDEQALGIEASGVVEQVASTPGTRGVDGYHFYFEVRVDETPAQLKGFSLRLRIPIESTEGAVTAVPISAVSLAADGTSRVQVQREGGLEYVTVQPGLSAGGFVEVRAVDGELAPGDLVVVGFEEPDALADL